MKNDRYQIKTDRLIIKPELDSSTPNTSPNDPDAIWDTGWSIFLKNRPASQPPIGTIRFGGAPVLGKLSVSFDINELKRNCGFASEALKGITNWLFWRGDIFEIEAFVPCENDPAMHVLANARYVYRTTEVSDGVKTERYSITKPYTSWSGLYLCLGIVIGLALGIIFASPVVGLIVGLVMCYAAGSAMDNKIKKNRERITGQKDQ